MMKKVNIVVGSNKQQLEEIEREVVFSGGGICRRRPRLILGIEGYGKRFFWNQDVYPAFIRVGDKLRGFYYPEFEEENTIGLAAYEILGSDGNVLTRSTNLDTAFVEDE